METNVVNSNDTVYFDSLHLINFQAWKNRKVEFSRGLNVFWGDNNGGKSVFMKFVRLTICPNVFNARLRNQHITFGAEFSQGTYKFSNGYECVVRIYRNKSIYFEKYANEDTYTQGEIVPSTLLKYLSVIKLDDSDFIPNMMDLDHSMFLVNSNARSNVELLKLLTYNEQLAKLKDISKERYGKFELLSKRVSNKLQIVDSRLARIQYVDEVSLERDISDAEETVELIELLMKLNICFEDLEKYPCPAHPAKDDLHVVEMMLALTQTGITDIKEVSVISVNELNTVIEGLDLALSSASMCDKLESIPLIKNAFDEEHLPVIELTQECSKVLIELNKLRELEVNTTVVSKDDIVMLDTLVSLSQLSANLDVMDALRISDVTVSEDDVKMMEIIKTFNNILLNCENAISYAYAGTRARNRINYIEKQFIDMGGERVQCPVYGAITHLNGQCIHNN